MDLSAKHFAKLFDEAFGYKLEPPFDPYRDSLNFMLSCYALPYAALVGYVGTNSHIKGYETKRVGHIYKAKDFNGHILNCVIMNAAFGRTTRG